MKLANRIRRIKPSATLAISAKTKTLRAKGVDIIGFGAGEPDFDTPESIKEAAIAALREGFTKYTPVGGVDELKDAIARRLKEDYRLHYERSEILVSCGAKHSLYNISQALYEVGDEVIIPSPYWVTYPEQVILAEARPVFIHTREEDGFKIDPDDLKRAITPKTKVLILNYPSNPTGTTYKEEELRILVDIALGRGIIIISDEIYEKIVYDGRRHTPVGTLAKDFKENTILVSGVSKTYSMTGWRIGFTAGKKELIQAMSNIQGQCTSNPTSISQKAAIEALVGPQEEVERMVSEFQRRRDYVANKLNSIPGIRCFRPQGAFYAFPNISEFFGRKYNGKEIKNSIDFTEFLLEEAKVAVVPGQEFGRDEYIRISYATSMQDIEEGLSRIEKAVEKLRV